MDSQESLKGRDQDRSVLMYGVWSLGHPGGVPGHWGCLVSPGVGATAKGKAALATLASFSIKETEGMTSSDRWPCLLLRPQSFLGPQLDWNARPLHLPDYRPRLEVENLGCCRGGGLARGI